MESRQAAAQATTFSSRELKKELTWAAALHMRAKTTKLSRFEHSFIVLRHGLSGTGQDRGVIYKDWLKPNWPESIYQ